MRNFDYKPFYRRNLPHIQPPGATLFVTFHLAGSLPRSVLQQWKAEQSRFFSLKRNAHQVTDEHTTVAQKQKYNQWKRQWFRKIEKTLDMAQSGPVWLKDDQIAKEVAESIHYLDGKVYRLDAYCIMANHVHVVFTPLAIQSSGSPTSPSPNQDNDAQTKSLCYNSLSSILRSLKGYTARKANQRLGRRGAFWQHENYDHAIRNESEWQRIVTYVLNNPVKIGLVDRWEKWQWNYYRTPHCTENF